VAPAQPITQETSNSELTLGRVRIHGIAKGKIAWELEADNFDMAKNSPMLRITGVKMLDQGKQDLMIKADCLERNTMTGDVTMSGNVTLIGPKMLMRTPSIRWSATRTVLELPQRFTAQIGDFAIKAEQGALYDVKAGTLRSDGKVVIATQGNVIRAMGCFLVIPDKTCSLTGPAEAELETQDIASWSEGKSRPELPKIADDVKKRYQLYLHQPNAAMSPMGGMPRGIMPSPIQGGRP